MRLAARSLASITVVLGVMATGMACSSADDPPSAESVPTESPVSAGRVDAPPFVESVDDAIQAVETELGAPQQFFEVTSNAQFVNVFVAVDDATAAVAYAFFDGELQPPAPEQDGASGQTFTADDVDFDPDLVLSGVASELPTSDVDAISVYGDGAGATYVLRATSGRGGFLDIVVGPQGQVFSVDPV